MRKQTKLVAVLSAAALLAIGASMTSFAAGWQKSDDGTWQYYDKDDEMVTGEWKKDGAKWFYLDDDGNMMTDAWVNDESYVGADGAMLTNEWKKVLPDTDIDDPSEDGENWYYFDAKGKKVTTDKKIGGKTYYFKSEGAMETGWYENGSNVYYLGGDDEGWRQSGWLWLTKPDSDDNIGGCTDSDQCDEEGWYYFGGDGKMYNGVSKKKINGKFYFFNEHGQMLYEWINGQAFKNGTPVDAASQTNAMLDGYAATPGEAEIDNMLYANEVEQGWRADGWYEIDGAVDTKKDSSTNWYFFKDGKAKKADRTSDEVTTSRDGKEYRAKIKVAGKYFCFNEYGQMQTGLQAIKEGTNTYNFYFFDANGYMKTGKVANVEEDNDSFSYNFNTKNGKNGVGTTGPSKDGYLYFNGKRLEAEDDCKLYVVEGKVYLVNNKGKLQKALNKDYAIENEVIGGDKLKITLVSGSNYEIKTVGGKDVITGNLVDTHVAVPSIYLYDHEYKAGSNWGNLIP